jgi:hypothetical protein
MYLPKSSPNKQKDFYEPEPVPFRSGLERFHQVGDGFRRFSRTSVCAIWKRTMDDRSAVKAAISSGRGVPERREPAGPPLPCAPTGSPPELPDPPLLVAPLLDSSLM